MGWVGAPRDFCFFEKCNFWLVLSAAKVLAARPYYKMSRVNGEKVSYVVITSTSMNLRQLAYKWEPVFGGHENMTI